MQPPLLVCNLLFGVGALFSCTAIEQVTIDGSKRGALGLRRRIRTRGIDEARCLRHGVLTVVACGAALCPRVCNTDTHYDPVGQLAGTLVSRLAAATRQRARAHAQPRRYCRFAA